MPEDDFRRPAVLSAMQRYKVLGRTIRGAACTLLSASNPHVRFSFDEGVSRESAIPTVRRNSGTLSAVGAIGFACFSLHQRDAQHGQHLPDVADAGGEP